MLQQYMPKSFTDTLRAKGYCVDGLPSEPLPKGKYLVHNMVKPARTFGARGFG
jgi:hypothetical protein